MPRWVVFSLVGVLLTSGCVSNWPEPAIVGGTTNSTNPARVLLDPLERGKLNATSTDYDGGTVLVGGPDPDHRAYEYEARIRGHVWYPTASGSYPTILFLHGQHNTCGGVAGDLGAIPLDDCADYEGLARAYRNDLGYGYLASALAEHGYVVVSILAYEINLKNGPKDVGMWARGELVLGTLDAIRDGLLPPDVVARSDLSRVGVMGHSRGGEGVVTAVAVNNARPEPQRHQLRAVVALAPTDFNRRGVPDVALLSLVPYCDGDVARLHGLRTFDHSIILDNKTPKVQVFVRGANHNFYNTMWYRDADLVRLDEAGVRGSRACDTYREDGLGWRWTPEETQREAITHVNGFLRWQVGNELGLAPYFSGETTLPRGACPAGPLACADAVVVSARLPGARVLSNLSRLESEVTTEGFDSAAACAGSDCDPNMLSSAHALSLAWSDPATLRLRVEAEDWRRHDVFSFRAAVPGWNDPMQAPWDMVVIVTDTAGRVSKARPAEFSSALDKQPDPYVVAGSLTLGEARLALQSVRIPLATFAGIDLSSVESVEFAVGASGRIFLAEPLVQAETDVNPPSDN